VREKVVDNNMLHVEGEVKEIIIPGTKKRGSSANELPLAVTITALIGTLSPKLF